MNELEKEYLDNVARSKGNGDLFLGALYCGCALILGVIGMIADDFSAKSVAAIGSALGVAALVPGVFLAKRFQRWFDDRNVEVTTTERERAYRQPVIIDDSQVVRPAKPWLLALMALIPVGVATTLLGAFSLGVTVTGIGIILSGKRVYGIWRTRRNARLELKWEKWLDSADACQVGPRKWTK